MENENKNQVAVYDSSKAVSTFNGGLDAWELAQRKAKALAQSDLVPAQYKGNVANCLVALEIAQRCQASPLMVAQNLNIIHGKPSWSSSYIIAAINSCGRFEPLRFKMTGEGDKKNCIAWTKDRSGEILEGPEVSIAMAKAEGWFDKNGSKWKTMPDLMLRYRAASFFGRLYASEALMGMRSDDEEREIIDVTPESKSDNSKTADAINEKIKNKRDAKKEGQGDSNANKVEGVDGDVAHF